MTDEEKAVQKDSVGDNDRVGRTLTVAAGVVLAAVGLSACGSPNPYCAAVEDHRKTLVSFGADKSDEAFETYADALAKIAELAPGSSSKAWAEAAEATRAVVTTHQEVGFALQDMDNAKKREGLSSGDIATLNKAYAAFNETLPLRKKAAEDAESTCDITL